MVFPITYKEVLKRLNRVDPISYGRTRNYADGAVTRLSPYISRGVISTRFIMEIILNRGINFKSIEKFIQELAWRDYWQQVWITKVDKINQDLKSEQQDVSNHGISKSLQNALTRIDAIDQAITELKETGYMHNHMRMYVASIATNVAKSHWLQPAKWMYYYLLDGDWASNALSWQWVAGSNANKKYYANQDNINKYFYSNQKNTFLDIGYEELVNMQCPEHLDIFNQPEISSDLPVSQHLSLDPELPTLIYNYYNLDPMWRHNEKVNRVLLLEPTVFKQYPVSPTCLKFVQDLMINIPGIQLYTGEFVSLLKDHNIKEVIYKEHPLNDHYVGHQDERDWMFDVKGYFPSFFNFWNKCMKELKRKNQII